VSKSQARPEAAQRWVLAQRIIARVDENAFRRRRIEFGVVARHDPLAYAGPRSGRSGWRNRHRLNPANPSLGQVPILVGKRSVVLPANAEIQRQPRTEFVIVLKVGTAAARAVAMNDSVGCAAGAEQASLNIARCSGLRVAGTANQQVVECSHG